MWTATVVLVEGGWSTGSVYDALVSELGRRGVTATASNLVDPGSGDRLAPASEESVDRLNSVIDAAPGVVVLVAHSGGGNDITAVGNHEKVAHMVFMSAFMPGSGAEVSDWRSRAVLTSDGVRSHYDPHRARQVFFEDLDPGRADAAVAAMVPTRIPSPYEPSDPSWRHRPTTFIVFDEDQVLTREDQLAWAAHCDQVVHVEGASHFGFMSQPARVAEILADIANAIE